MAKFADLKPSSKRFIQNYPFPELSPPAFNRLSKPLEQCRVALVTTAGLHMKDEKPFSSDFLSSDCSYRVLPRAARLCDMSISHTSGDFDRSGIQQDLNVVLPLERLEELVATGKLGSVATQHYSFMGSLPRTGELRRNTAPAVAALAAKDAVDIVLLTPV